MEKKMVMTGKTMDLAIEAALTQLGLTRDDVSVEILAQAKPGFLGFGATPAKVQITYEVPDLTPAEPEKPRGAFGAASRSNTKKTKAPVVEEAPKKPEAPKAEPKKPAEPKVYAPAEPGSVEEKIEQFLKGLLEQMNSDAVPHAWKVDEDTYNVELTGSDLGYLIGRRGDTLDALQHLANYSVNRHVEGHIRINVDAEAYREKREESLRRYAQKKAQQVLKAHRRTTLEPMNAYERHVIHATLQDMDRITTYSVGTEPNRRVVIEYVR